MINNVKYVNIIIERIKTYAKLCISFLFCLIFKIRKGRVLLWSTEGKDYSCNPLYISNYILDNESNFFEVYWMFRDNVIIKDIDPRIKTVRFGSIRYLYILQTAEFLITNHRTSSWKIMWIKREEQKYIMTWHGSMPLKKIEKDALCSLSPDYSEFAKKDSKNCNLMLSDSKWFSELLKNSFWYEGEILEKGMPRNDILFDFNCHNEIKEKVARKLGVNNYNDCMIILYAPTFRTNHSSEYYIFKWKNIIESLEKKEKKKIIVLLRLHPTLLGEININDLITENFVVDASTYNNMQELLVASDLLITDYSSTMFEYTLLNKPCFLYTPDLPLYDRGTYFPMESLPFKLAFTEEELINNLITDDNSYIGDAVLFLESTFHIFKYKNASRSVVEWMKNASN